MKEFFNVLVTGGAGFIGSHLVDRLMSMGCFVRVVDNVKLWFGNSRFEFVRDDGRGWRGDVKTMLLSADRFLNLGWKPSLSSEGAVRLAVMNFWGL